MKHPSWRSELLGLWEVLQTDIWIVFLFPMFLASNWFYSYQFNGVNGAKFNIRTRALNNTLYWISQIIGAYVFGYMLDIRSLRRTLRAKVAWGLLFVLTMVIWGGGYAWQKGYTRAETSPKTYVKDDWTTRGYVGPMFLYMFYGFYDGAFLYMRLPGFPDADTYQRPGKHASTGSLARSQTTAANSPTSQASIKAYNPLAPSSHSALTPLRCLL